MASRIQLLLLLLLVTVNSFGQQLLTDFIIPTPENPAGLQKLDLWGSHYFLHQFKSGGSVPIVYRNGKASGLSANPCDFCEASLQGTAFITDADGNVNVIKFARTGRRSFVDCRKCEKFAGSKAGVAQWGKALWIKSSGYSGALRRYKLIPFRSIAVDRRVIPYGTVLYIPKAKGTLIELPDGRKISHDGYFFAADRGGLVKNNHIDFFTGIHTENPFPEIIKSNSSDTFEAFIVKDKAIINALKAAHRKGEAQL